LPAEIYRLQSVPAAFSGGSQGVLKTGSHRRHQQPSPAGLPPQQPVFWHPSQLLQMYFTVRSVTETSSSFVSLTSVLRCRTQARQALD
jgi:hypothetical protein